MVNRPDPEEIRRTAEEYYRAGDFCCRVLTRNMTLGSSEHMEQCISFTGEVAKTTARIILRELEA